MSAPEPTTFAELVAAVRELYRGTKYATTWRVIQRQPAHATGPIWEIDLGSRQLCGDTPEHVFALARTAFGFEPDGSTEPGQ